MSLVLNTNINSLNAQNNLTGSQASLSQSLERLSSGLRINSAADDAAGLGDQPAVHDADQRHEPSCQQRERRRVGSANDCRRAQRPSSTTCRASAPWRLNRPTVRTAPRIALLSNNQVQQQIAEITQIASADHLQRFERAQRQQRHDRVPGRCERRRHHCRSTWDKAWPPTRSGSTRR